jgi:2-polyprenyl-3-methyl-5-hydroxy-6-metoxy-1,4-benzoquinol methylase
METPGHDKPAGYFGQDRAELVRLLPKPVGRVLDVGCGEGATGRSLRAAGADWISGVELDSVAASTAEKAYDEVLVGPVEEQLDELSAPFDTVLAYDVLEHLVDPRQLLNRLHDVAVPGARLHVSVPNARHWTLLRDLAFRGTFGYTPAEHRDVTHLRWFTPRDLVDLLESTGWRVEAVDFGALRPLSRLAARLTRGRTPEFLAYQMSALARRP